MRKIYSGFTLIEMIVTITIISVLVTISIFGLQGARESARDSRRKADLSSISVGLEIYRSDCNQYPASLTFSGTWDLRGSGSPSSCPVSNVYLNNVPSDPQSSAQNYLYVLGSSGTSYALCAALEEAPSPAMDLTACGASPSCGGVACNYIFESP